MYPYTCSTLQYQTCHTFLSAIYFQIVTVSCFTIIRVFSCRNTYTHYSHNNKQILQCCMHWPTINCLDSSSLIQRIQFCIARRNFAGKAILGYDTKQEFSFLTTPPLHLSNGNDLGHVFLGTSTNLTTRCTIFITHLAGHTAKHFTRHKTQFTAETLLCTSGFPHSSRVMWKARNKKKRVRKRERRVGVKFTRCFSHGRRVRNGNLGASVCPHSDGGENVGRHRTISLNCDNGWCSLFRWLSLSDSGKCNRPITLWMMIKHQVRKINRYRVGVPIATQLRSNSRKNSKN